MKIIKNTSYLIVGNVLIHIIPLIFLTIFSRMYSLENFGHFAKFLAASSILSAISIGQYHHAIVVEKEHQKIPSIFTFCIIINTVLIIFFGFLLYTFQRTFNFSFFSFNILGVSSVIAIIIYAFLISNIQMFVFLNNRKEAYKTISLSRVILAITVAISTYFIGIKGESDGLIIGSFIGVIVQLLFLVISTERIKYVFKISVFISFLKTYKNLPMYTLPHSFFDMLKRNFIIFIIGGYFGDATLGLYAIAEKIIRAPVGIIGSAFSDVFRRESSIIYHEEGVVRLYYKVIGFIKIALGLIVLPTIILTFYSEYVFELLLGENWKIAGTYFKYMSPLMIAYFITSPLTILPILLKNQKVFFIKVLVLDSFLYVLVYLTANLGYDIIVILSVKTIFETLILIYLCFWITQSITKNTNNIKLTSN